MNSGFRDDCVRKVPLFFEALIPRVLLSILFWSADFRGPGGDPEAYHLLGRYLATILMDPLHADLRALESEAGVEELEVMYAIHRDNVERFWEAESVGQYLNTVMPVVFVHGLLYWLWDSPLAFPLFNSLVSAWAVGAAAAAFGLGRNQSRWLVWNPASLFFAATHFKESITESLVLAFAGALYGRGQTWRALGWCAVAGVFRVSYSSVLLVLYLTEICGLGQWRTRGLACLWLAVLWVLPDIHEGEAGLLGSGVFGKLAGSEPGRKVWIPILGLVLPVPFQGGLHLRDAWALFSSLHGIAYHWAGWRIWSRWRAIQESSLARRVVNGVLTAGLMIGYLFLGGPGVKDRYFAPFLGLWIVGAVLPGVAGRGVREGLAFGGPRLGWSASV